MTFQDWVEQVWPLERASTAELSAGFEEELICLYHSYSGAIWAFAMDSLLNKYHVNPENHVVENILSGNLNCGRDLILALTRSAIEEARRRIP